MDDNYSLKGLISESERLFQRFFSLHRSKFIKIAWEKDFFPGQGPIIIFIERNNGCTQKEIANAFKFKAASVTEALKRMEKSGLITRCQDESDLRITRVFITEKGKAQMKTAVEASYKMEECCLKGFTEEEKKLFISFLKRVCDNLEDNKGGTEC